MLQINTSSLKNGLTVITIDLPHLDSVTSMIAVGAGSRFETKKTNGISHFLEHIFFKGSKKYPSAQQISTMIDEIGAVSNAGTSIEFTFYWVKSASRHLKLALDIISSMLKEPIFDPVEIEREKGVIIEEMRRNQDNPSRQVWDEYLSLQFGSQPLGWKTIGNESTVNSLKQEDFFGFLNSLYTPQNMALILVGKLPKNSIELAEKYYDNLPNRSQFECIPYKEQKQLKPRVSIKFKQTNQANLILGVAGYNRHDPKRFAATILGTILGEGMSSRLYMEVREKRGLAYTVLAAYEPFIDAGMMALFAGLKLEKTQEGLEVIVAELSRIVKEKVTEQELKKAKEIIRGRIALRSESTNFLAEHFGIDFILDRKIETFEQYLKKIEAVTAEDVLRVAKELFQRNKFNLQIIGPFKSSQPFIKILS